MGAAANLFRVYCVILALIELPALYDLTFNRGTVFENGLWYSKDGASFEANVMNATFLAFLVVVRIGVAMDDELNPSLGFVVVGIHLAELVAITALYRANVLFEGRSPSLTPTERTVAGVVLAAVFINPMLFSWYFFGRRRGMVRRYVE